MLWSKLFIPTLREPPAGIATEGALLLSRAGYVRGDAHLLLGKRSLDRIAGIIREELAGLGAQEFSPANTPLAWLAREVRSYKQLPQVWFQLRDRLEACSFGISNIEFINAARAILRRCGIECVEAESHGGRAFVVPNAAGEQEIARAGSYAAILSGAVSTAQPAAAPDPEGDFAPEAFHTANVKTIAELAQFTGLPETSLMKSVVMADGETLFLALLRGDHQLSQEKLETIAGVDGLVPANPAQIRAAFGASAGSLGPVGAKRIRILADEALRGRRNLIAGANRDDYHLRHVTPGKDFPAEFFDLRQVEEGDTHDGDPLHIEKAVQIGDAVSATLDLHVTDESGKEIPVRVCSCSLSLERILWTAAEQHHDADGLILPPEIAPFNVIVTLVDASNADQRAAADRIAKEAHSAGLELLIDDRPERPGVKFKDADLIGVPSRVTIGKKLEHGLIEFYDRASKRKEEIPLEEGIFFRRIPR